MAKRQPKIADLPPPGGHLAVVLLSGIGDAVHGLPVVSAIKRHRPDLRITWIAEPAPAAIPLHNPAVDEVVTFDRYGGIGGVRRLRRQLRALRPFHLTLNLQRYFKSIFPTVFSGAPLRIGLPRDKTRDGVSLFSTHHLEGGRWKHTQDLFLDFLDALGVSRSPGPEWGIAFTAPEELAATRYFEPRTAGPRVGVVLASANPNKDWPAERYPALVDALAGDLGFRVFLLGGPGERERAAAGRVMTEARNAPVRALSDSVRELMWKIRGMDLVVSPDTSAVHIARALEVPVIGLYGHTNPWRVGPYLAFHDLLVDRFNEAGATPDPSRHLAQLGRMEKIEVRDVLERAAFARTRYAMAG